MPDTRAQLDAQTRAELAPSCDMDWQSTGPCANPAELIIRAQCAGHCPPVARVTCRPCARRILDSSLTQCRAHGINSARILSIDDL